MQLANIGLEVAAAPTDQKAKVLAQGASNAVLETVAVETSFELGSVLGGVLIPIPIVGSLIGGAIFAGITAYKYDKVEKPVNNFIQDTVNETNRDIEKNQK